MLLFSRNVENLFYKGYVLTQPKRYRGKINIQRPRAPHHERAKVLKLTEPYFPSKYKNLSLLELCENLKPKLNNDVIENPYQKIIARECLNWFKHSKLISLFHINPMTADEKFKSYVAFRKENMYMKVYGLKTLQMALNDTEFEAFTTNYVSQNLIVFSSEANVKEMLKITRRFPQLILLAGVLEGKFLCKDELITYGHLIPDMKTAQTKLLLTLQNAGGQFMQQMITQQQITLINLLNERTKQLK